MSISKNYFGKAMFRVADQNKFNRSVAELLSSVEEYWRQGVFMGDNLLTFGKNLSFLNDQPFVDAIARHAETDVEKSIIWRTAVLVWAARNGLKREGAFVECGCYRGISARIICDTLDFNKTDKDYYLYDLFEYPESGARFSKLSELGPNLYEDVKQRFADIPRARIVKGAVPDSLHANAPEMISFLHIDMNDVEPEIGALDVLFDRVVPGGIIILDDYGYVPYVAQRDAEHVWFANRGYHVIELPTCQGMVIR